MCYTIVITTERKHSLSICFGHGYGYFLIPVKVAERRIQVASDHRYFLQEISVKKSQRFKEKPLAVFYFGKVKVVLSCFHEVHVFVLSFVKPFKKCFLKYL